MAAIWSPGKVARCPFFISDHYTSGSTIGAPARYVITLFFMSIKTHPRRRLERQVEPRDGIYSLSFFLHIESTRIGGDDYIAMLSREMSSPSFFILDQHTSTVTIGAPGRATRCHRLSFIYILNQHASAVTSRSSCWAARCHQPAAVVERTKRKRK